jgi:hypothetical protein
MSRITERRELRSIERDKYRIETILSWPDVTGVRDACKTFFPSAQLTTIQLDFAVMEVP